MKKKHEAVFYCVGQVMQLEVEFLEFLEKLPDLIGALMDKDGVALLKVTQSLHDELKGQLLHPCYGPRTYAFIRAVLTKINPNEHYMTYEQSLAYKEA